MTPIRSWAKVIQDQRTALNITQGELAAALSVSVPVLRRVEKGLPALAVADLVRVARVLKNRFT